jgi:hypothetical protein
MKKAKAKEFKAVVPLLNRNEVFRFVCGVSKD